jgi:hypothetical protein
MSAGRRNGAKAVSQSGAAALHADGAKYNADSLVHYSSGTCSAAGRPGRSTGCSARRWPTWPERRSRRIWAFSN